MTVINTQTTIESIPLHQISTAEQVRMRNGFDAASLNELAASIAINGLMQPIMVEMLEAGKYQAIAGHRRLAALQLLKAASAPCIVTTTSPTNKLTLQLIENVQRSALTTLDTATAVTALAQQLQSTAAAAKALGKSRPWVSKHCTIGSAAFSTIALQLLADGATDDADIAITVHQIARLDEAAAIKAANAVRSNTATRETLRQTLAALKAPHSTEAQTVTAAKDEALPPTGPNAGTPGEHPYTVTLTQLELKALIELLQTVEIRPELAALQTRLIAQSA